MNPDTFITFGFWTSLGVLACCIAAWAIPKALARGRKKPSSNQDSISFIDRG